MDTVICEDMIAKAVQLLLNMGVDQHDTLGKNKLFQDNVLIIQSFIGGVDLIIKYADGSIVLEIWKGKLIMGKGDYMPLYEHLNKLFYYWHAQTDMVILPQIGLV
jgi:hypothetical protein